MLSQLAGRAPQGSYLAPTKPFPVEWVTGILLNRCQRGRATDKPAVVCVAISLMVCSEFRSVHLSKMKGERLLVSGGLQNEAVMILERETGHGRF